MKPYSDTSYHNYYIAAFAPLSESVFLNAFTM